MKKQKNKLTLGADLLRRLDAGRRRRELIAAGQWGNYKNSAHSTARDWRRAPKHKGKEEE